MRAEVCLAVSWDLLFDLIPCGFFIWHRLFSDFFYAKCRPDPGLILGITVLHRYLLELLNISVAHQICYGNNNAISANGRKSLWRPTLGNEVTQVQSAKKYCCFDDFVHLNLPNVTFPPTSALWEDPVSSYFQQSSHNKCLSDWNVRVPADSTAVRWSCVWRPWIRVSKVERFDWCPRVPQKTVPFLNSPAGTRQKRPLGVDPRCIPAFAYTKSQTIGQWKTYNYH